MTMGILANNVTGSKNQKNPTPNVNNKGKTKTIVVILNPSAPLKLQAIKGIVNSDKPIMLATLYCSVTSCIAIKPKDRSAEVVINLFLLDIY